MAAEPQLDAAGSPKGRVIRFLAAVWILCSPVFPQSPAARQKAAQRALDAGDWAEAATLARGPADQSPELDFLAGLALARLEKWSESKLAFEAGFEKAPRDPRFLVELAGLAYQRVELHPGESGNYDLTLHLAERNGWGHSKVEGLVSLLSGLPYFTVYPEFYNLAHQAVNLTSLARWDPEKRRASLALALPLFGDPRLRLRLYTDARNENWNLTETFLGAGTPLAELNMRRAAMGVEAHALVNAR